MTELRLDDFDAFFRELHGEEFEPFAWQRDLVRRVASEGWPSTLELPTASGKTAVIDIAVFTLALDPLTNRRAPLRIFFVVDRRVVVDEAHRRAGRIAARLAGASSGVAYAVAQRLRTLAGKDAEPLVTAVLRGGIYREDGWARSPVQPLIAVSTVDQVGSRLLGRGYGVGDGMKPVHQGLVAHDSLIVLDEAHLSEPFHQTLGALQEYARQAEVPLPRPCRLVVMSATPKSAAHGHLRLGAEFGKADLEDHRAGRLLQRLEAHKRAELLPVEVGKRPPKAASRSKQRAWSEGRAKRDGTFCDKVASAGRELLAQVASVGVVVNRVGTARMIFEQLRGDESFDAVLLTGRSRPLDRDAVIASIWARARAGRERHADERKLVVVATQCIEAGADLDFDGLVTECASLDALKQRFGRLNQFGEFADARAVVIVRSDTLDSDPVYGEAIGRTWRWLQKVQRPRQGRGVMPLDQVPQLDFGHAHLPSPAPAELEGMLAPPRNAPILLPVHLDAWAMTSPRPAADPDVAQWLHGVDDEATDVQIVWRADLPPRRPELWADTVALCPPGSAEAMPVPVYAACAWLAQRDSPETADTIISIPDNGIHGTRHVDGAERDVLRWCGEDDPLTGPVGSDAVRPGETLVVPEAWGGADEYGWLPTTQGSPRPVADLGDRVQLEQRGRATLRICDPLRDAWVPPAAVGHAALRQLSNDALVAIEEDGDVPDVDGILRSLSENNAATLSLREIARRLLVDPGRQADAHPLGGVVLRSSRRKSYRAPITGDLLEAAHAAEPDFTSQDNASSFVARPVSLSRHSLSVGELARVFARGCGLRDDLVSDIALAGTLHDVGKADPRFQRWLHGGDEVAVTRSELLAKSGMRSRRLRERARVLAGYPKAARHELLSLAMIEPEIRSLDARDAELVLHLVSSHHGFCRPFAPAFDEPDDLLAAVDGNIAARRLQASTADAARLARLDSGVAERYWSLVRKFGWLGLPYIEAILRLADHRCSELDELEEDDS